MSVIDPRLIVEEHTARGYWNMFTSRLKGGELGSLPVIIGLAVIWTVFQTQNAHFLTAANLTNLFLQVAAVGLISLGVNMVLLLGEVDLSVGSVSGVASALLAVLYIQHGWNPYLAIFSALLLGAVIGLSQGFFFTKFGVPSFVVTLAGLIGWQGLQLRLLGSTGSLNVPNGPVTSLTTTFFSPVVGWTIVIAGLAIMLVSQLLQRRRASHSGLPATPLSSFLIKDAIVAACMVAAIVVFNNARGLPLAVLIFVGLVILFDLVLRHTSYGRHVFAVGGNSEAARRAGIRVTSIRLSVFAIAGTMAAAGGIMAASRLFAVNQSSGSGDTLLDAIAAAVIGGTSLFGGRGSAYAPLLGMMVIGSISNGLDLLGQSSATKFMITGAVLLAAVTIDAVARRGRQHAGR